MELKGKVAVVTGASRGLGFAIAQGLVARGARVVLASRRESEAGLAASGLGDLALGVGCDVRELAQVDALAARAIERFGQLDLWVNNAGASAAWGPTRELAAADFLAATQTVVLGTYHGTQAALRHLVPRGEGCLVNLLGRGEHGPVPNLAASAAAKAWVRSFTLTLELEQRGTGLAVIAFQPGLMDSRLMLQPAVVAGHEEEVLKLRPVMRLFGAPPSVPAERLLRAIGAGRRGRVRGTPPLWMLRGPLRMVFGGRPDFVISPRVLPRG